MPQRSRYKTIWLKPKRSTRAAHLFFVNGRRLAGAQPFPKFKALIDEMLKK